MTDPKGRKLPAVEYDHDAITARLRNTASTWVPELFRNGRKEDGDWRLANIQGDAPRVKGSCVIALEGDHAGDWFDFDGDHGGGPLSTLEHATRLTGDALLARAADMTAWTPGSPTLARREPVAAQPGHERDAKHMVASILQRTLPVAGTRAEAFLRGRGLSLPDECDLRFHPELTYWETRTTYPAMIGVVRDLVDEPVAVHRTYLQADKDQPEQVGKAPVGKPRMLLGKTCGGAVRLAPVGEDGLLGLSEGIETGLAAMATCPTLPVWATLSTSGLTGVQLPPEAKRVVILADHDESGAGMRAAEAAAHRFRGEGRSVAIALPPQKGDDFNDLLLREGPMAVAQVSMLSPDSSKVLAENSPVRLVATSRR